MPAIGLPNLAASDDQNPDAPFKDVAPNDLNNYVVGIWTALKIPNLDLETVQRAGYLARNPGIRERKGLNWDLEDPTPQLYTRVIGDHAPTHGDNFAQLPLTRKYVTESERDALERESGGELRIITHTLANVLIISAIAAFLQGQVQESIVGANITWPVALGIADNVNGILVYKDQGLTYFSLVNAIPYFAAGVFGCVVSDPIAYLYGRRKILALAAVSTLVGTILSYYVRTWQELCAARVLQGIGIGAKAAVVTVYISEVSPRQIRGRLLCLWQTFVAVGIFAGTLAQQAFRDDWRAQLGVPTASAFTLLILSSMVRESPRWLAKQKRFAETYQILRELTKTDLQAFRDLLVLIAQLQVEEKYNDRPSTQRHSALRRYFARIPNLWTKPRLWRAVKSTCIVMAAQQCSGVNSLAFLASSILQASSIDEDPNRWINFSFGLTNALASAATFFIIDKHAGRRTLLVTSLVTMFPFLIATGLCMDSSNIPMKQSSVTGLIIIYAILYSPGAGVIPFLYSAEQFPQEYREIGMSIACSVNFILAGALAMSIPQYVTSSGHPSSHLFGGIAAFDGAAAILVWVYMRSTDDNAVLGNLNRLYNATDKEWLLYQYKVVIPWAFQRLALPRFWQWRKVWAELGEKESFSSWLDGRSELGPHAVMVMIDGTPTTENGDHV